MADLFSSLPAIEYGGRHLRNILYRPKLLDNLEFLDPQSFYPYVIEEGEKIEHVAHFYYGSVEYIWLIMLANDMVDPYLEWHLSTNDFTNYIASKYGSIANAQSTILYKTDQDGNKYSPDTTAALIQSSSSPGSIPTLTSVSSYDWEVAENEKRKHILLIDNSYTSQIERELRKLYNA